MCACVCTVKGEKGEECTVNASRLPDVFRLTDAELRSPSTSARLREASAPASSVTDCRWVKRFLLPAQLLLSEATISVDTARCSPSRNRIRELRE